MDTVAAVGVVVVVAAVVEHSTVDTERNIFNKLQMMLTCC